MKETQIKLNINFRILPFGHALIEIKDYKKEKEKRKEKIPLYIEPKTTSPEVIEITFGGVDYIVPKVTHGFI